MTNPTPPAPPQQTALHDEENMGWVLEPDEPVSEEDAYWRMRGMIPPARLELEE